MSFRYVLVLSEPDPVVQALLRRWPVGQAAGEFVEGAAVRILSSSCLTIRRPGRHIFDEHLDRFLPPNGITSRLPLIFPSVHRSETGTVCLTVHPVGNPGPAAELGGEARSLCPTDPALMASTLRALHDRAAQAGVPATFEATHHGPTLERPAFFAEVATSQGIEPDSRLVDILAQTLPEIEVEPLQHVALGVGGGHYAPYFTELTLSRSWAFGHILSRHALETIDPETARQAWTKTPAAEGVMYARAADAARPELAGLGPRLSEKAAPRREPTRAPGAGSASGT